MYLHCMYLLVTTKHLLLYILLSVYSIKTVLLFLLVMAMQ
nr:MAG TPA: hypothetical protein [Caudoviricetes sp.]